MPLQIVSSWDDSQNDDALRNSAEHFFDYFSRDFAFFLQDKKIDNTEKINVNMTSYFRAGNPRVEVTVITPSDYDSATNTKIFFCMNQAKTNAAAYMGNEIVMPALIWPDIAVSVTLKEPPAPALPAKPVRGSHLRLV